MGKDKVSNMAGLEFDKDEIYELIDKIIERTMRMDMKIGRAHV